jgi:hypothetical protein
MNANKTDVLELEMTAAEAEISPLHNLLAAGPRSSDRAEVQLFPAVGTLAGFADSGAPLVSFPGCSERVAAKATCTLGSADTGRAVVLVFEGGDARKPIILGLLQPAVAPNAAIPDSQPVNVSLDGEQVTLSAKNEIVLRCGKASITLTRAGKIIIRGAYLLSRSSGVNRIKGGSVQIN